MKAGIAYTIYKTVAPWVKAEGYECIGVDWKSPELTVFIERQDSGYMGIEDCVKVTRMLLERESTMDPLIDGAYELVVSSPGSEPPIMSLAHWVNAVGSQVQVELAEKIGICKKSKGQLVCVDGEMIHVQTLRGDWIFPYSAVTKANRMSEGSEKVC